MVDTTSDITKLIQSLGIPSDVFNTTASSYSGRNIPLQQFISQKLAHIRSNPVADLQYPPGGPGAIGVPWETIVRKAEPHEWHMTLAAMMDDFEERGGLEPEQLERVSGVLKWMQIEGKWPDQRLSPNNRMWGWLSKTTSQYELQTCVISYFLCELPGVGYAWFYNDTCPILALLRGSLIITDAEYRREFASLFQEVSRG